MGTAAPAGKRKRPSIAPMGDGPGFRTAGRPPVAGPWPEAGHSTKSSRLRPYRFSLS